MKSNIDDQMNLDEPHFDEEATILAARPVVPLEEVSVTRRSKGGLALLIAIGAGLIIGLLAATLVFRYFSANQSVPVETTSVTEQPANQVEQNPSNQLTTSSGGVSPITDETANVRRNDEQPLVKAEGTRDTKPDEKKTVPTPERAPEVATRPRIIVREPRQPSVDEEEVAREIRRAERQEERRERRRAARRQQRDQVDENEDLSRIREIFEGRPRP